MLRRLTLRACLFLLAAPVLAGVNSWTPLGPYDTTGIPIPCQSLAISPDGATIYAGADSAVYRSEDAGAHWSRFDLPTPGGILKLLSSLGTPSVLYAGTATGVFVSTDRGETWTASGLEGQAVYSLAIDPQSPATLYAGGWLPVFPEKGVISRSQDGGRHWEQLYAEDYVGPVVALAISPVDPSVLFAGSSDGGGLLRSQDAGHTWAQVDPTHGAINSILVDPISPSTVYASWSGAASPGFFPPAGSVRKSLDGGNSWFDVPGLPQFIVGGMAMDPRSPSALVVEAYGYLRRTLDGGDSWMAIAPAIYADELLTDPHAPETLYGVGHNGVQRLEYVSGPCVPSATMLCLQDGRFQVTVGWQASPTGPTFPAEAVPVTAESGYFWFFDPDNVEVMVKVLDGTSLNGHFWVFYGALSNVQYTVHVTDTHTGESKDYVNPAGTLASVADTAAFPGTSGPAIPSVDLRATPVARSTAASWSALGPERSVNAIAVDPRYPHIYASTGGVDYTVFKSNDGGATWVALETFPDFVSAIHLDLYSPDIVYAVTASNLYRSTDAGGTWHTIAAGLGVNSLVFDSIAAGTVYAGTPTGLFVSTDHGSTWAPRGIELAGKPVGPIATTSSGKFYAVEDGKNFWTSDDSGLSWSLVHEFEFGSDGLQSLVAPSSDPYTVYASESCCSVWTGSTPPAVVPIWKSEDGGSTWTEIFRAPGGAAAIVLDPSDSAVLYTGGYSGVSRSANGGASWTAVGEDLTGGRAFSLELQGSKLFAGTAYGVFELDLSGFPQSCQADGQTLCLNEGRFRVSAAFQLSPSGPAFQAQAVPLTGDTGYFWFFDDANVELVVKVLDGRPINGHFWVFYGALSSVEYEITVTDTQTGDVQTYHNSRGKLASVADTSAF